MPLNVLFICFNRPTHAQRSFERIRAAKPDFLYVAADGARPDREGEAARCDEVRAVFDTIDWPCTVVRDFAPSNMGCGARIETALQRTFEHVDRAVVLEDDLVPQPGFFGFVETMLDRYIDVPRVATIAGSSYVRSSMARWPSYYFSRYPNTLGWGTYKRVIDKVDWHPNLDDLEERLRHVVERKEEAARWAEWVGYVERGVVSTWDYQYCVQHLLSRQLAVTPRHSMVKNIGAGADATYTVVDDAFLYRPVGDAPAQIRHPFGIRRSVPLDLLHSLGAVQPRNHWYQRARPYGQEIRNRLVDKPMLRSGRVI